MDKDELAKITEKGVSELDLEWPLASSIYELQIPRVLKDPDGTDQPGDYLEFLHLKVFPLVDQLEKEAGVDYWHILNHANLDLRLSVNSEQQMEGVRRSLAQHGFDPSALTKWGTYDDPDLGSRLGCQGLLRLYQAQSRFTRDMVRSVFWLRENADSDVRDSLESSIVNSVPIYTSHMQLNIFPADQYYEAFAHLQEAYGRFQYLLQKGMIPKEAEQYLEQILAGHQGLLRLLR